MSITEVSGPKISIRKSDVKKCLSVVNRAISFHRNRDFMSADLRMAERVLFSPLTLELSEIKAILASWLDEEETVK